MSKTLGIRPARKLSLPHEHRFAGIDEAGRGPVLGPLVIAICALTKRDIAWCIKHNVTDSKKVPLKKREHIAQALMNRCWYSVAIIHPPEIDLAVNNKQINLNGLEIKYMSKLISEFQLAHSKSPSQIMVDAPVKNLLKFRTILSKLSAWQNLDTLNAQNHADAKHRHVGAASIIAKVKRDQILKELEQSSSLPLGSGYTSDPIAREYVINASKNDPIVRWSWITSKTINKSIKL
ncbi:ribonuclease HII [Patescibacteria group bacterium]|nr:ribonuclease HII [Patescibacteria group bacterium]